MRSSGIHLRTVPQKRIQISVTKMCFKMTKSKSQPHLPETNELLVSFIRSSHHSDNLRKYRKILVTFEIQYKFRYRISIRQWFNQHLATRLQLLILSVLKVLARQPLPVCIMATIVLYKISCEIPGVPYTTNTSKYLYQLWSVRWNYLSIPKPKQCCWNLEMDL